MSICIKCTSVGHTYAICGNCNTCKKHIGCRCMICSHCDKKDGPKNFCPRCNTCKDHHTSKIFSVDEFPFRKCEYAVSKASTFILNPLKRSLGMEIELGDFKDFRTFIGSKPLNYWFDHDASVAGSGLELVTEKLTGDAYLYNMLWLIKNIKEYGCTTNNTCGYHLHVEASDLDAYSLRRILIGYTLIQDQLYGTLVSESRKNSSWGQTYCPKLNFSTSKLLT